MNVELPDYDQHDAQYRRLREGGFLGWGGESFATRMAGWRATVEALLRIGVFPKAGHVLELGSGAGDSLIPFAEAGYRVTGIEVSPAAVEWAREKFAERKLQAHFHLGNIARGLAFEDFSFDAVVDAACLHCIIGDDRKLVLDEVYRVLKPGGFFLVSHMVNDPRELNGEIAYESERRLLVRAGTPYRSIPTEPQLNEEVSRAGFRIVKHFVRSNPWWDHAEFWCIKPARR